MGIVKVTLVGGEERTCDGDVAEVLDESFVVYKWRRRNGRIALERSEAFPADRVVVATLPDGTTRLGRGGISTAR